MKGMKNKVTVVISAITPGEKLAKKMLKQQAPVNEEKK